MSNLNSKIYQYFFLILFVFLLFGGIQKSSIDNVSVLHKQHGIIEESLIDPLIQPLWDKNGFSNNNRENQNNQTNQLSTPLVLKSTQTNRPSNPAFGKEIYTFTNHTLEIESVAISPDGTVAASGSRDLTENIRLWNLSSGEFLRSFSMPGFNTWTISVDFSPDGKYLASGSNDGKIVIWDLFTGTPLHPVPINAYTNNVESLKFSPDSTLLASGGQDAVLWDVSTGNELDRSGPSSANTVDFSPNGTILASGFGNKSIILWKIIPERKLQHLITLNNHSAPVSSVKFSIDGLSLASSDTTGLINYWDLQTNLINTTWTVSSGVEISVEISGDGNYLASTSNDLTIRLWNLTNEVQSELIEYQNVPIRTIAFSPDGTMLISGDINGNVMVWNVAHSEKVISLPGHSEIANIFVDISLSFSSDNKILISAPSFIPDETRPDHIIKFWNGTTGNYIKNQTIHTYGRRVENIDHSPDGQLYATGGASEGEAIGGSVRFWNTTTSINTHNTTIHFDTISSIKFSPDGQILATGTSGDKGDSRTRLWDAKSGNLLYEFPQSSDAGCCISEIAFSPDGKYLAATGDNDFNVWDLNNYQNKLNLLFELNGTQAWSVDFSPNGKYLALGMVGSGSAPAGNNKFTIQIYDVFNNFEPIEPFLLLSDGTLGTRGLRFSPDGNIFASASKDGITRLWDTETRSLIRSYNFSQAQNRAVEFSPDGNVLALSYYDGTFKFLYLDQDYDGMPNWWENQYGLDAINFWNKFNDTDQDGVIDSMEFFYQTNPINNDTDGDILPDGLELQIGLNPLIVDSEGDSDGDGIPNVFEYLHGMNLNNPADRDEDLDGDGLSNYWEWENGFDPNNAWDSFFDTDNDGMPNFFEFTFGLNPEVNDAALDNDSDGMPNLWEYQMLLRPNEDDSALDADNDGLPNLWEYQMGLSARDSSDALLDTDSDGLKNLDEYIFNTSAILWDTDTDSMSDGYEFQMGLNPLVNDAQDDLDADGMPNLWEFQMNLDASKADTELDSDGDGLSNLQEFQFGTWANQTDTDLDGMPDLYEFQMGLKGKINDAQDDLDDDGLINLVEYQLGTLANNIDSDNDGMTDGWEVQYELDPTDSTDAHSDFDGDGISNLKEFQSGTNPRNFLSIPIFKISFLHMIGGFIILMSLLGFTLFTIYRNQIKKNLTLRLQSPDYSTALAVQKSGFSSYSELISAKKSSKNQFDTAVELYYERQYLQAMQKFEEVLDVFERIQDFDLIANTIFRVAQILLDLNTLTEQSSILRRFPNIDEHNIQITAFEFMINALMAERKENWGDAEAAWKNTFSFENLPLEIQGLCQGELIKLEYRSWIAKSSQEIPDELGTRLIEWIDFCKLNQLSPLQCEGYLLHVRIALATYQFQEVESWLDRCLATAKDTNLLYYQNIAEKEMDIFLHHKKQLIAVIDSDKPLSKEEQEEMYQDYIKRALRSLVKEKSF